MTSDARYDGFTAEALAHLCGVPRVALWSELGSTMDQAHALAESGSAAGTLVLTDRQTAGRGRGGRPWASEPGQSITLTLIERPADAEAIAVLALRLGLRAAGVLDRFAGEPVLLKWPNDLMLRAGKVGGILVEARWREQRAEWVAIGIGINLASPAVPGSAGLDTHVPRAALLSELVPALRAGAQARGSLGEAEIAAFAARDWARGREARSPAPGIVRGVSSRGALVLETTAGLVECATGSLVLTGA